MGIDQLRAMLDDPDHQDDSDEVVVSAPLLRKILRERDEFKEEARKMSDAYVETFLALSAKRGERDRLRDAIEHCRSSIEGVLRARPGCRCNIEDCDAGCCTQCELMESLTRIEESTGVGEAAEWPRKQDQ